VLLAWLASVGLAQTRRPNIVFIFSDDHALQAIGAYGSRINQTPNIDRIAREGTVFLNSFCANSLCGPSRACIQTGKHSHLNGFLRNGNRFESSQTTFPKLLQQAGYQTAVIGKWHLETDPAGFDFWQVLPGQGSYYNPDLIRMDGSRQRHEGYCTDIITDLSLQWLKQQRDTNKPFLLMCQHKATHRNWAPAARHFDLLRDRDVPEPETLFDDYAGRSALLQENEMSIRGHFFWGHDMKFHGLNQFPKYFVGETENDEYRRMTPEQRLAWDRHYEPENRAFLEKLRAEQLDDEDIVRWKYQRFIKDYLRCIAAVDESVGRILDYLDQSGLAENTIVIYSSDQGFYLGEHGWYDKRWMFEESLKMPLIIRWPHVVPASVRSDAMVQNIDYGPTFLDAAGVRVPAEMQGESLLPVFNNGARAPAGWRDAIYYAYYENDAVHHVPIHDGVRTNQYKLMFFPRTREWQLFDLAKDPRELHSVHDDPQYADALTGLQKRYRDLRKYYDVNSATIPATRGDEDWWKQRQNAVNDRVNQGDVNLAFIGDSITQGWDGAGKSIWDERFAGRKPINMGFSGDRTEHVIWRLMQPNLTKIQPKVAVLMIGTNNTGHSMQDPEEVAEGVHKTVDLLKDRWPTTQLVLLGIFPRGKTSFDPMRLNNVAINQVIQHFADNNHVHYLDIGPLLLNHDGSLSEEVMPDLLHLSSEGYRRWADAIEPKLRELGL
jgi:N-acetylglucosamine-6-sulfatase